MATFICPECGREVISDADLEGKSADCARCGAHVENWPAPVRATRKPSRALSGESFLHYTALVVFVVLALIVLIGLFGRR